MEVILQNDGPEAHRLKLRDTAYEYSVSRVPEIDGYLIMLTPEENLFIQSLSRSIYTTALMILLLFGIVVYASSIEDYVRNTPLPPSADQKYKPSNIRRLAMLYGLIGVLLIAIGGWLDQSLNGLYDFSVRSRDILNAAEKNIETSSEWDSRSRQDLEAIYLYFGSQIADILNGQPELRSSESLQSFCERIGASSITLYDSQGKETASSGDYVNLELGSDPQSATWEFRRILKGVPSLFREAKTDEETGLNKVRVGIRLDDPDDDGKYNVMIIALPFSMLEHDPAEEINTILRDMTVPGAKLWISNLATGRILASGDRDLIGKTIGDLGLNEEDLRDRLMRDTATESGRFHVASSVLNCPEDTEPPEIRNGLIAFYSESTKISNVGLSPIVVSCIAFIVIYTILLNVSLSGYTDEFYNECRHSGIRHDDQNPASLPAEDAQSSDSDISFRKKFADSWSALPPERKGLYTVEIIAVYFLLLQIPLISVGKEYAKNSVNYIITTGNWNKGPNLFALAAIVNLTAEILLCVIVVQMILKGLALLSGAKGKTIFRLIGSLVRYIALFTFLILGFNYLGVDRATLIASVAAVSLALSLGAQNLIDDVISGVAVVFEGILHVGDIVQIADSTGKVLEIGIRCTKILEDDGDIVTISNRQIGKVVNMTQHCS